MSLRDFTVATIREALERDSDDPAAFAALAELEQQLAEAEKRAEGYKRDFLTARERSEAAEATLAVGDKLLGDCGRKLADARAALTEANRKANEYRIEGDHAMGDYEDAEAVIRRIAEGRSNKTFDRWARALCINFLNRPAPDRKDRLAEANRRHDEAMDAEIKACADAEHERDEANRRNTQLEDALRAGVTVAAQYLDTGRGDLDGWLDRARAALKETA